MLRLINIINRSVVCPQGQVENTSKIEDEALNFKSIRGTYPSTTLFQILQARLGPLLCGLMLLSLYSSCVDHLRRSLVASRLWWHRFHSVNDFFLGLDELTTVAAYCSAEVSTGTNLDVELPAKAPSVGTLEKPLKPAKTKAEPAQALDESGECL